MKFYAYALLLTTALAWPVAAQADSYRWEHSTQTMPTERTGVMVPVYERTGARIDDKVIQSVQQNLKDSNFYRGAVNGVWDIQTQGAVAGFQASKGLRPTGMLDNETILRLGLTLPSSDKVPTREDIANDGAPMPTVVSYRHEPRMMPRHRMDETAMRDHRTMSRDMASPEEVRAAYHRDFRTMNRAKIQAMQQALADGGFYRQSVDGVWGRNTTVALREYQKANGLRVTGRLNPETLDELGLQVSEADKVTGMTWIETAAGH